MAWGDTGAFVISEHRVPADYRMDEHAHACGGLALVLEGRFELSHGRSSFEVGPGQVFVLPAGAAHSERSPAGARCLLIQMRDAPDLDGLEGVVDEVGLFEPEGALRVGRELAGVLADGAEEALTLDADAIELLLEVHAVLAGPRPARGEPPWVRGVAEILRRGHRRPPTLFEVAEEVGLSPWHVARTFRVATGCTVGDYLRRQRLLRATRRLRDTTLSLAAVAYETGYTDQSHMTRQFRRYLGVTPMAYRSRG